MPNFLQKNSETMRMQYQHEGWVQDKQRRWMQIELFEKQELLKWLRCHK